MTSLRALLACAGAVAASLSWTASTELRAQARPAASDIRVLPIRGNTYLLMGAGANVVASVGKDGVLLVDSGTAQNADKLLAAVRNLGIMGSKTAGEALVDLYSSDKDPAVRKAALEALFIQGNSIGLVALARKEQDPQMKRAIVERLSHRSDKVARDYMLELLK